MFSIRDLEIKKLLNDWIVEVEDYGVGEILLTSIDLDGKMTGYDLHTLDMMSSKINIPLIASGGASSYDDFYECFSVGCIAGSRCKYFSLYRANTLWCKKIFIRKNIPVRL